MSEQIKWYLNRMGDGHEKLFELCIQGLDGDTRTTHEDIAVSFDELRELVVLLKEELPHLFE